MMVALLALLWPLCLGTSVAWLLSRQRSRVLALSEGALLGPSLTTLIVFLTARTGADLSQPEALWPLAALTLATVLLALRARPEPAAEAPRMGPWLKGTLIGLAAIAFSESLVALLAHPAPRGDGFLNMSVKAQMFLHLADWEVWLKDPRVETLHPDYPLHLPLSLWTGYRLGGADHHLAALAPTLLWKPGLILALSWHAARFGRLSALCAGLLGFLWVGFDRYVLFGYSDAPLAGLLLLAVQNLHPHGSLRTAIVALALMPWVKLEGAMLAFVFGIAALAFPPRSRRTVFLALATAGIFAALWPLEQLRLGLFGKLKELEAQGDPLEYLRGLAALYGRAMFSLDRGHGAIGFLAFFAGCAALFRLDTRSLRFAGALLLALWIGFPILTFVRQIALLGGTIDTPFRIAGQWVPLALWLAPLTLFRRTSAEMSDSKPVP